MGQPLDVPEHTTGAQLGVPGPTMSWHCPICPAVSHA
jgi:hypothetical protein